MPMSDSVSTPMVPKTFWQYVRSMGPGVVIVLTWLGAGDLVDSAVAGGNYGYALMWAMMVALAVRFVFVSILAKYQLCNQHGESVMSGFNRIHPSLPVFFIIVSLIMAHFYGAYMVTGAGEAFSKAVGFGPPWAWSIFWVSLGAVLVFKGIFRRIEIVFFLFLALLSISLIGVAIWSGPNPVEAAKGALLFSIPENTGSYDVVIVVTSLIGAVGGTITNLFYPYFIEKKNWKGPKYRKLQLYDLAFAIGILIILDLAVWTIGAELLHPTGKTVSNFDDLAGLLTVALGHIGGAIFYLGVFGAVITSAIGNALGFGYLIGDATNQRKKAKGILSNSTAIDKTKLYKIVVVWTLFSPLIWTLPGAPGFVVLTITVNAASVVLLPVLSGSIWYITSRKSFIGLEYRNKWWEHVVMAFLFILTVWASKKFIQAFLEYLS